MKIKVSDYTTEGFSANDAEKLKPRISEALQKEDIIEVDFSGVEYFTTLFFGFSLTLHVDDLGKEEYIRRINVTNLVEPWDKTYEKSLNFAIKQYAKSPEEREQSRKVVASVMEDL